MAARRLDTVGLVVVLLGGAEAGMAQYQMGVADMGSPHDLYKIVR
jgi:hypothetical protein